MFRLGCELSDPAIPRIQYFVNNRKPVIRIPNRIDRLKLYTIQNYNIRN